MDKKKRIYVALIAIVVCGGAMLAVITGKNAFSDPVLTVNGIGITDDQFIDASNKKRALILSQYPDAKEADKMLIEETIEECVRTQILLQMGNEMGLLAVNDYQGLMEEMELVNSQRSAAVKRGEVVYGPESFSRDTYLDYTVSNLKIELQKKLKDTELACTEAELEEFYNRNKESVAKAEETLQVTRISAKLSETMTREQAEELLNRMKESDNPMETAESEGGLLQINDEMMVVNSLTYNRNPKMMEELFGLPSGAYSSIYSLEQECILYLSKGKTAEGILPFEQVKEDLTTRYQREKFEKLLQEKVKQAEIRVDERAVKRLISK